MVDTSKMGRKYYNSQDLEDGPIDRVIRAVEVEGVGVPKQDCLVLYFEGDDFGAVVGAKCRRKPLQDAYGTESDNWVGHKIRLYTVDTTMAGRPCKGIRFKPLDEGAAE